MKELTTESIAYLHDFIFEGLDNDLRNKWTERLLRAIPVGADLTLVLPVFLLSLLDGLPPQEGDVKAAIEDTKKVMVMWRDTGKLDKWVTEEAARIAARAKKSVAGVAGIAAIWVAILAAERSDYEATEKKEETWTVEDAEISVLEAVKAAVVAAELAAIRVEREVWKARKAWVTKAARKKWSATAIKALEIAGDVAKAAAWIDIADNLIVSIEAQGTLSLRST